jgi:hypothetical protein
MNIAVVSLTSHKLLIQMQSQMIAGFTEAGHTVREIDGMLNPEKLTPYHYIVFFIDSRSSSGGDPRTMVSGFFQQAGTVTNKYVSVFINNRLFAEKTLSKLMKLFEEEGVLIHFSDVIKNSKDVEYITNLLEPVKPGT